MNKRYAYVIFIILFLLVSPGCGASGGRPVERQKITVHAGKRFKVVLDCNHECGFRWKLSRHTDSDIVLVVDSELVKDPTPADTTNAYDVWTFMAQNPGHTEITLNSTKKTHIFALDVVE